MNNEGLCLKCVHHPVCALRETRCQKSECSYFLELIRCEDCEYWKKATVNKKGYLICPASGMEITYRDFCSYGERRKSG